MISPADIAAALGRPTPEPDSIEWRQWDLWITDARMLIENRLGDLGELDQTKLDYVTREAVVAQVRRPDDSTQVDVSIDDGRVSKRFSSGSGRVRILDEWWALLDPTGGNSGRAFAIDTAPSDFTRHLPWCSLMFGAAYCSCGVDIAGEPIFELGQ
nr:MAG TPA_asm: hypothetical protein [Caudoviricetes sp.]